MLKVKVALAVGAAAAYEGKIVRVDEFALGKASIGRGGDGGCVARLEANRRAKEGDPILPCVARDEPAERLGEALGRARVAEVVGAGRAAKEEFGRCKDLESCGAVGRLKEMRRARGASH